ncbi:DUF3883 domain-containing protein [Propionibacterium freudenreichii]|nr:DUF3883 domain-containing protein [Propionibacterium freudenreichii]
MPALRWPRASCSTGLPHEVPCGTCCRSFPEAASTTDAVRANATPRRGRGQAYLSDAERRSAIERHAVAVAIAHYRSLGATEITELGKPYDLRLTLNGQERHVEVKGSTVPSIETIELTQGEVVHARGWAATDLVVVDGIECGPGSDGPLTTSGGRLRIFNDWSPAEQALQPTQRLPGVGGLSERRRRV